MTGDIVEIVVNEVVEILSIVVDETCDQIDIQIEEAQDIVELKVSDVGMRGPPGTVEDVSLSQQPGNNLKINEDGLYTSPTTYDPGDLAALFLSS